MRLFKIWGLQRKLGVFVLSGLTLCVALFSLVGVRALNEITDSVLEQRLDIARIMASDLDRMLSHALSHVENVAATWNGAPAYGDFVVSANALRNLLDDTRISIENIVFLNAMGEVEYVRTVDVHVVSSDWSGLPDVKKAFADIQPSISNILIEPSSGRQMILAIAPVTKADGKIAGLLGVILTLEQDQIRTAGQMLEVGETGYVEIVDGNGLVIARTEPGVRPNSNEKSDHPGKFSDLIRANTAVVRTCHRCHEVNQGVQRRRDILAFAPLSSASWGVAIRQDENEALAPARELGSRLGLLGVILLICAFPAVWFLARSVVSPIVTLEKAARRVAAGDFTGLVPVRRSDEIGQLGNAFYAMTRELEESRNELLAHNKKMSILNAVGMAVGRSLDIRRLSENALGETLEITHASSGCVFMKRSENSKFEMVANVGGCALFDCQDSGMVPGKCACYIALKEERSLMVNDERQCPQMGNSSNEDQRKTFVSIPLKSQSRVMGVMNVSCSSKLSFSQHDFGLFDAIGFQVGLAIENSLLYGEAKDKEKLRGTLLSGVITAQEDERKRISRELHDGSGQMLTAAIMNLESLETLIQQEDVSIRNKLLNTKAMMSSALEDLRRLTYDLRPMTLDDLGLETALRTHVRDRLEPQGIEVKFESDIHGQKPHLDPVIENSVFRVVQEAVNNITKHANAHHVSVTMTSANDMIEVIVSDDGKGFDPYSVLGPESARRPLGLLGIRERTNLLGGAFHVSSSPNKGTRLTLRIPVDVLHQT